MKWWDSNADSLSDMEDSNSWMPENDDDIEVRSEWKEQTKFKKKYNRKEKSLGELCK